MGGTCKSHGNEFSTYAELYVSIVCEFCRAKEHLSQTEFLSQYPYSHEGDYISAMISTLT